MLFAIYRLAGCFENEVGYQGIKARGEGGGAGGGQARLISGWKWKILSPLSDLACDNKGVQLDGIGGFALEEGLHATNTQRFATFSGKLWW